MAKELREKFGEHYQTFTSTVKEVEDRVKEMLTRSAQGEDKINWLPDESEDDDQIQWLKPQPVSRLQATLDYAKQLSEKVYGGFRSVSGVTSYLPHQLKDGATQAYDYSQEMYSHLKSVSSFKTFVVLCLLHHSHALWCRSRPLLTSQRKLWTGSRKLSILNLDMCVNLEPTLPLYFRYVIT